MAILLSLMLLAIVLMSLVEPGISLGLARIIKECIHKDAALQNTFWNQVREWEEAENCLKHGACLKLLARTLDQN